VLGYTSFSPTLLLVECISLPFLPCKLLSHQTTDAQFQSVLKKLFLWTVSRNKMLSDDQVQSVTYLFLRTYKKPLKMHVF